MKGRNMLKTNETRPRNNVRTRGGVLSLAGAGRLCTYGDNLIPQVVVHHMVHVYVLSCTRYTEMQSNTRIFTFDVGHSSSRSRRTRRKGDKKGRRVAAMARLRDAKFAVTPEICTPEATTSIKKFVSCIPYFVVLVSPDPQLASNRHRLVTGAKRGNRKTPPDVPVRLLTRTTSSNPRTGSPYGYLPGCSNKASA